MKIKLKKKPRIFYPNKKKKLKIADYGQILLEPNEQICLITNRNSKHEITRKEWGFYATQSINSRLKKNFKTAITENSKKNIFIMMVEKKYINSFKKYCKEHRQKVLIWLDKF